MEFALLCWPGEGRTLRLDYRRFAYAGKFVLPATGKAVVCPGGPGEHPPERPDVPPDEDGNAERPPPADPEALDRDVLAAAAFDGDRADPGALRVRYLTVRADRRGEGIGPRLAAFVADRAERAGWGPVRIAVNNPFAYGAAYRAGFAYTGRETGLAELLLERPGPRDPETYRAGLAAFRELDRELAPEEAAYLREKRGTDPPPTVAPPAGSDESDGPRGPPVDADGPGRDQDPPAAHDATEDHRSPPDGGGEG